MPKSLKHHERKIGSKRLVIWPSFGHELGLDVVDRLLLPTV